MPTAIQGNPIGDPGKWAATTVTALNAFIRPIVPNGYFYKATSIGAGPHETGGAQPTWPLVAGGTVVDGNVTWTCWGAMPAFGIESFLTLGAIGDPDSPAELAISIGEIADWVGFISLWAYVQEDQFAARDLMASGRNIPAGATLAGRIPGGGAFTNYQGTFGPSIAAGSTYITSTGADKPELDVYASESAGQLSFVPTGTALPTGATKLVTILNNAGAGSLRTPEAVIFSPMNGPASEMVSGNGAGPGEAGMYWAPHSGGTGWDLWFQNDTGSPLAIGNVAFLFSYVAIF